MVILHHLLILSESWRGHVDKNDFGLAPGSVHLYSAIVYTTFGQSMAPYDPNKKLIKNKETQELKHSPKNIPDW